MLRVVHKHGHETAPIFVLEDVANSFNAEKCGTGALVLSNLFKERGQDDENGFQVLHTRTKESENSKGAFRSTINPLISYLGLNSWIEVLASDSP